MIRRLLLARFYHRQDRELLRWVIDLARHNKENR